MGKKWFRERRGVYVPDQQGCYEMERGFGGTLSVYSGDASSHEKKAEAVFDRIGIPKNARCGFNAAVEDGRAVPEESEEASRCRLGLAKQKGKLRVVTMQTAIMKDVLRPVHEAAYDRLTQRSWLVRGDVKREHFESLRPTHSPGHDFISGDYEASTDNLHTDAVLAVVETLAEDLPPREADLFVRSFRDCQVSIEDGGKTCHFPVVRGSMMGNLGSFVVLCILNRICYERALKLAGYSSTHGVLINGDDILFTGESGLYYSWLHSTSEVGFVINTSKTMRSRTYGDLNSQTYRFDKSRKVKKLCFGFLGSDSWKEPEGSLARPLFELCKQVKFSSAAWLLTAFPVRKLLVRAPLPLSSIPHRWWNFLVKRSWFRGIFDNDKAAAVETTGVERSLPFVLGAPLKVTTPFLEQRLSDMGDRAIKEIVNEWIGVPVPPLKSKRPHTKFPKLRSKFRLGRQCQMWKRLWLAPVLDYVTERFPELLLSDNPVWVDDQPGLQSSYRITRSFIRPIKFSPPSSFSFEKLVYQSDFVPCYLDGYLVNIWN